MSSTSGGNDGDDSHWSLYRGGMNDNGWMNGNAEMGEDDEDITLDPDYEDAGSSFGSDNSGLATAGSREMPGTYPLFGSLFSFENIAGSVDQMLTPPLRSHASPRRRANGDRRGYCVRHRF